MTSASMCIESTSDLIHAFASWSKVLCGPKGSISSTDKQLVIHLRHLEQVRDNIRSVSVPLHWSSDDISSLESIVQKYEYTIAQCDESIEELKHLGFNDVPFVKLQNAVADIAAEARRIYRECKETLAMEHVLREHHATFVALANQ